MNDTVRADAESTTLADLIELRLSRRSALKALGAAAALSALGGVALRPGSARAAGGLGFSEIAKTNDETHHAAPGYDAAVLVRWGDPIVAGAPALDPKAVNAASQEKQFGYNCDFIGFMPLPLGSGASDHGLLCVNHEYTIAPLMFPGFAADAMATEQVEAELAAHGHSVVEVKKLDGRWQVVADGPHNRRLSMLSTAIGFSGPAAGHDRLKTKADPAGTTVIGLLNCCAGGTTPWGTVLIAEENFHQYFSGDPAKSAEASNHERLGIKGKPEYRWGKFVERFDVETEPNEPNRFSWVVELDP